MRESMGDVGRHHQEFFDSCELVDEVASLRLSESGKLYRDIPGNLPEPIVLALVGLAVPVFQVVVGEIPARDPFPGLSPGKLSTRRAGLQR